MNDLLKNILSELQVETLDEFDRNFVRKAFFDRPWPARRAPGGRGTLLAVTGRMRRSLRCSVGRSALSFFSDTAYFSLHNRGGTVPITAGMRKYFWAMYYKHMQGVSFNRKTKKPAGKRSEQKHSLAEYYKSLALTTQKKLTIPQRQVVGDHPKIGRIVRDTCARNVRAWIAKNVDSKLLKLARKQTH